MKKGFKTALFITGGLAVAGIGVAVVLHFREKKKEEAAKPMADRIRRAQQDIRNNVVMDPRSATLGPRPTSHYFGLSNFCCI